MIFEKPYFFCGVGGSGMLPLALILRGHGAMVSGSDRALDQGRMAAKFEFLKSRGIALFPQDGSGVTSSEQIVVISAAVEDIVPDVVAARRMGATLMSRAELLAQLFNAAPLSIGVAGTSGKSTVTGMIGWMLTDLGRDPTIMNGAVMKNFVSADAPFASARVGTSELLVSEVDESDGSIARYTPSFAVVNNISLDHKTMDELRALFRDFVARSQIAILNFDNAETAALIGIAATEPHSPLEGGSKSAERSDADFGEGSQPPAQDPSPKNSSPAARIFRPSLKGRVGSKVIAYSFSDPQADLRAENLSPEPDGISFEVISRGDAERHSPRPREEVGARGKASTLDGGHDRKPADAPPPETLRVSTSPEGGGEVGCIRVRLQVPGAHNVYNALAALGVAQALGIPLEQAAEALSRFTGIRRRLEIVGSARGVTVIDDFAHNPDKIAATLATLHAFPGRLLILFQPHGYGPLRKMKHEFIAGFARDLASEDILLIPEPVYYGGTTEKSVTSEDIARGIREAARTANAFSTRADCGSKLLELARPGDRIVVMGARDDTLATFAADLLVALEQGRSSLGR